MGRRIEHTRKISSDRVRKRRHPKKTILIAIEGNNKTRKHILAILKMARNHII